MRRPTLAVLATAVLTASSPLAAQSLTAGEGALQSAGAITVGALLGANFPMGDLEELSNVGLTFGAQGTYGLGVATLLGEVSYSNFTGRLVDGVEIPDQSAVAVGAGLRASIPLAGLYVGALASWWTDDVDEFDVVPMVGIHLGPADLGVRYKGLAGDAEWFALTGAVHFGLR